MRSPHFRVFATVLLLRPDPAPGIAPEDREHESVFQLLRRPGPGVKGLREPRRCLLLEPLAARLTRPGAGDNVLAVMANPPLVVHVHVHVHVKPEAVEAFRAASVANAEASRREGGVVDTHG